MGDVHRLSPMDVTIPALGTSCVNALAVSTGASGDVLYVAGAQDYDPHLCVYGPAGSFVELHVPTDRNVNALAVEGSRLWLFGNVTSVLSWPLP
jgi:hypothetical protein